MEKTKIYRNVVKLKSIDMFLLIRAKGNEAISDEDFTKMQSLIPNCLGHEMSHPDHNVHLGNKEEFYKYFDEFLKS
ncbi:hypothetical protein [Paenibacillus sp. FSL K6-2524]|uniref:hypothetical protein n=1 Tax=Paenibacillus sp. FSL K6-2524 TaxID=2954516 RepID=UPI0030F5C7DD